MNTFDYLLMSEMSDWFAVPGHVRKSDALRRLIREGLLDWIVDEVGTENSKMCEDCLGDGCEWCDEEGVIIFRRAGWRYFLEKTKHGYVKRDPNRAYEEWYVECTDLDEGAEPVTILDL